LKFGICINGSANDFMKMYMIIEFGFDHILGFKEQFLKIDLYIVLTSLIFIKLVNFGFGLNSSIYFNEHF